MGIGNCAHRMRDSHLRNIHILRFSPYTESIMFNISTESKRVFTIDKNFFVTIIVFFKES